MTFPARHRRSIDSPSSPATGTAPLVLVVEDDEDLRMLYQESLEFLGYRTAGEPDGAAGVAAATRLLPDAILMDVAMTGMDGIEATRQIKAAPATSGCFVVVMTGRGMTQFEHARAAGCDAFVCKPFEPAALDNVLRGLLFPEETAVQQLRPELVKTCACGRELSLKQWLSLPVCGRMHVPARGVVVELRNCTCGSSLAVELDDIGNAVVRTAPAVASPGEAAVPMRETLLVVDRDSHIRRLVELFLGDAYVVEFANDGYSALDRVRACAPAAVITEILIPRFDGLALCRALKADPLTQSIPILVISALAAHDRAPLSGANAFLAKPLEKTSLVGAVRSLLAAKH